MKTQLLGTFEVGKSLLAIDPCYQAKEGILLQTKPGTFAAYLSYGKLKKPFFPVDTYPTFFRTQRLLIQHTGVESLTFRRHSKTISVDSGMAGFFIPETFGQNFSAPRKLMNTGPDWLRSSIINAYGDIQRNTTVLTEKLHNETFKKIVALENNPTEGLQRATEFFEQELAGARWRLAHAEKHLVEKTLPHYCKEEFSDEFYEYIIDVGNQFASLGGVDPLGTVSQTGLGDGGYRLMVAKEDGLVVAAYIEYLPTKEFKSSETQDSLKIS